MSNLHVHSDYSARDSIQKVSAIFEYQLEHGQHWAAITDHGTMSAHNEAFELQEKIRKEIPDFTFYPGVEFYLRPESKNDGRLNVARLAELKKIISRKTEDVPGQRQAAQEEQEQILANLLCNLSYYHITVLAYNQQGLENLYRINNAGDFYYKHRVALEDLKKYNEGLVVLTGCPAGVMFKHVEVGKTDIAEQWLREMKEVFGDRLYVEIQYHDGITELERLEAETDEQYYERRRQAELAIYREIINLARKCDVKLVATNDSHYTYAKNRRYWEITRKCMLSNAKYDLSVGDFSMMKDNSYIAAAYSDLVTEEELDQSEKEIVDRLTTDMHLPHSIYKSTHKDRADFERMVWTGFKNKRLGTEYEEKSLLQIPYEMAVIQTKGFDKYFLIQKKIIKAAYDRGVLLGPGRGSAAGAECTYLCDITKTDPIKYGLMFERFLNPGRDSMPDVDIDFESYVCRNFDYDIDNSQNPYVSAIGSIFERSVATDEEIATYWDMWRELSNKHNDQRRKKIFDESPTATYFDGPVWEQPEDIIVVKDR